MNTATIEPSQFSLDMEELEQRVAPATLRVYVDGKLVYQGSIPK